MSKNLKIYLFFLLTIISFQAFSNKAENVLEVNTSKIIVSDINTEIEIKINKEYFEKQSVIFIDSKKYILEKAILKIDKKFKENTKLKIEYKNHTFSKDITPIPLYLSIIPPLIAIAVALIIKEVFTALFLGIFSGTFIISFYSGENLFKALGIGFLDTVENYIVPVINDGEHVSIIVFSMLIGAMVSIISKNGGMHGIVNFLSKFAQNAKSGQFFTWLMGVLIFFDDYANTLIVGNTMRPVTDRLKISREKLAYIVDSTAAPIASIAFITTWIGAEISYIKDSIEHLSINETAYSIFINSLSYAFYPIFALIFILILIFLNKDFGPMYKVENQMRCNTHTPSEEKNKEKEKHKSTKWYNAGIPIFILIFGSLLGLYYTGIESVGSNASLSTIIGAGDSFKALLWASLSGLTGAILLSIIQKLMSLKEMADNLLEGLKNMLPAISILILAWAIALITKHLHTANFISNALSIADIPVWIIPGITFVFAALVAFSTGSSWGTMAILYPLIIPASMLLCEQAGYSYEHSMEILYNVVSTVLAGSVLGDHCSPISDTTILSSLASDCNHISHVQTQMPYALTVGAVALLIGTIPGALNIPAYITFPVGVLILFFIVWKFGKKHKMQSL